MPTTYGSQEFPASVAASVSPGSLGNRDTVAGLVGRYMAETESLQRRNINRELSSEDYMRIMREKIERMRRIFEAEDPEFSGIKGWHRGGLRGSLRVDLHDYMKRRGILGQDPIAAFFGWISDSITSDLKAHGNDAAAFDAAIADTYRIVIDRLMGTGKRMNGPRPEELEMPPWGIEE